MPQYTFGYFWGPPRGPEVVNRKSILSDFFQGDIERLLNNASELDILGRIGTFGSIRKTF